jgi:excisionase family DNA binding protein
VLTSRKQARAALGLDDTPGLFDAKPIARAATRYVQPEARSEQRASEAVGVLTLGEAAVRLGVSRSQLEALIDAGKVEALPTGFTRMIPTTEVKRLLREGIIDEA